MRNADAISDTNQNSLDNSKEIEESSETDPPLAKSWREDEARALLLHRISMDGEFRSMKTHKSLWKQISTMLKEQNITATPDQCDNKFKAMKKDYKSAKDHNNKSGNGTKTCRFFEEFDQLYGCRAGTTPEATLCSLSVDDTSTSTPQRKKTRKRPAASSTSVLEQIEKRCLGDLPADVFVSILCYLSPEDCCNLAQTNKHLKQIIYRSRTHLHVMADDLLIETLLEMEGLEVLKINKDFFNKFYKSQHLATIAKICEAIELGALQKLKRIEFVGIEVLSCMNLLASYLARLPLLTAYSQTHTSCLSPAQVLLFLKNIPSLRFIVGSVLVAEEDKIWWAKLLNELVGQVTFGHSIIDTIPAKMLCCDRSAYSWQCPTGITKDVLSTFFQ
ncbi:uncharacterized protein LOC117318944 [Pecten maximus]|uniref:uncharacterized protein LOC117318944 n=1 Tax=Pecten maximus TaxID=6579 RepID=UPI001458F288|nr:uncharacterized protein LOC117318944 [Pecten maximus]